MGVLFLGIWLVEMVDIVMFVIYNVLLCSIVVLFVGMFCCLLGVFLC